MPVTGQRVVRRALGRRLTRLRTATGKSRREVAEAKLGISEPTLHRIETGKVPVTVGQRARAVLAVRRRREHHRRAGRAGAGHLAGGVVGRQPGHPRLVQALCRPGGQRRRRSARYDGEIVPGRAADRAVRAGRLRRRAADRRRGRAPARASCGMQRQTDAVRPRPAAAAGDRPRRGRADPAGRRRRRCSTAQIEHLRATGRSRTTSRSGCCRGRSARTPRWPARSGSWTSTTPTTPTWSTSSPTSARCTSRRTTRSRVPAHLRPGPRGRRAGADFS